MSFYQAQGAGDRVCSVPAGQPTRIREAPAREKNAMLTSGVSSARVCPSSSCKALLAASPLHVSHAHALMGTLEASLVSP